MRECPRCGDNRIIEITEATWACTYCRYMAQPAKFLAPDTDCPRCHSTNTTHITGATFGCYDCSNIWSIGRAEREATGRADFLARNEEAREEEMRGST
jgi:ribosomal protein L37AE/L43A